MNGLRERLRRAGRRVVGALIGLLPAAARELYGSDLLETFERLQADARNTRTLLFASLREVGTLLVLLTREWLVQIREWLREVVAGAWASELRFAARSLRRSPLYTLTVAVTLGLGVAGVTVVYSVVRATLLARLPYGDPATMVRIFETPRSGYSGTTTSMPNVLAWQERSRTLEHIVLASAGVLAVVGNEAGAQRARAARVSRGTFELLAVRPYLGALPAHTDFEPGGTRWVVVSHSFWKQQLGADSAIVRRTVRIDGADAQVVAVMAPGFSFPDAATELLLPLRVVPGVGLASPNGRWARLFQAYARIRPGSDMLQVTAELRTISAQLEQEFGPSNEGMTAYPRPLRAVMLGDTRNLVLILLCAAALVLAVACSNVAALTLVRTAVRSREIAIRIVHGASRVAIGRQLGSEILLLCLLSLVMVVYLTSLLSPLASRLIPAALPHHALDTWRSVPAALIFGALAAGALFMAVLRPRVSRPELGTTLGAGGARTTGSARQLRARAVLVCGQIAIAIALLATGGALLRSYFTLTHQPVGFETRGTALLTVSAPGLRYADPGRLVQFYDEVLARARALPGLKLAGLTDGAPLTGGGTGWTFVPEGSTLESGKEPSANTYTMDRDYLAALGVPLLAGRLLEANDTFPQAEGVLVSLTLANRQFGSAAQAIGKRIALGGVTSGNPFMTIVGVVGDLRDATLDAAPGALIYRPHAGQTTARTMTVVLKASSGDALPLTSALTSAIREIDSDVASFDAQPLDQVVAAAAARPRFTAMLAAGFGLLALILSCVGLVGLLGGIALQQRRAQAIRLALGATRGAVLASAWRTGLTLIGTGAVLGILLAWIAAGAIRPFVFAVPSFDLPTLSAGVAAFVLIGSLAAVVPVWRATRAAPAGSLRGE